LPVLGRNGIRDRTVSLLEKHQMSTGVPAVTPTADSSSTGAGGANVTDMLAEMMGVGFVSQLMLQDSLFDPAKELINESLSD
jgi:hypothetical protein